MPEETGVKPSVQQAVEEFEEMEERLKQVSYTLTKLKEKFIEHVVVFFPTDSKRKLKTATYGISFADKFKSHLYIYFLPELMEKEPNFLDSVLPRLKRLCDTLEVDISVAQKTMDDIMDIDMKYLLFLVPGDSKVNIKLFPRPLVLV